MRVCVPQFFVSSQQRFGATDIKALGTSQLSGLRQTVLQLLGKSVLQLYLFRREQENPSLKCEGMPTQRLEEKRVEECAGEGERERVREGEREKESEKALCILLLYVSSSTWACPMRIGLSQECCLFYLKSSLWSLDLLLTFLCSIFRAFPFLVFQSLPFWTPFPNPTAVKVPGHDSWIHFSQVKPWKKTRGNSIHLCAPGSSEILIQDYK